MLSGPTRPEDGATTHLEALLVLLTRLHLCDCNCHLSVDELAQEPAVRGGGKLIRSTNRCARQAILITR